MTSGFSIVEPGTTATHVGEVLAGRWQPRQAPTIVTSSGSARSESTDDATRRRARAALLAYRGSDDYLNVLRERASDRSWLPNHRTATALLNVISDRASPQLAVT